MNRDVLLIYLRDLRDLEVARQKVQTLSKRNTTIYNTKIQKLNDEIKSLRTIDYVDEKSNINEGDKRVISSVVPCSIMAILCIPFAVIFQAIGLSGFALFCLGALILFSFMAYGGIKTQKRVNAEVQSRRATEDERWEQRRRAAKQKESEKMKLEVERNKENAFYQSEYNKISALLTSAYSANILATPYRNLQSVYYIYDYMSTSQASLDETLLHEHMENGIQRILEKLDTIIAQNEEIIFHSRMIEANTRAISDNTVAILEKNQRILESQERTEQNTLETAQNAEIAANYAEVNAFFSAATYLDRQRR